MNYRPPDNVGVSSSQLREKNSVPPLPVLRRQFLDERRHDTAAVQLDCVAHMLVYLDQPERLLEIALSYLVRALNVCRGDAGIVQPRDPFYAPSVISLDPARAAPTMLGAKLSNRHPMLQLIWRSEGPVRLEQVEQNPILGDLREAFIELRSRSMIARRLEYRHSMLGLICLDHTEQSHEWQPREISMIEEFCRDFLAPLLNYSLITRQNQVSSGYGVSLSPAELEVVRLAANGLSYHEIARALNKSVHTIDNQLRRAREKLGARNQSDLIYRATPLLHLNSK